jgi:tetratricopeptide (TPR) repeat protein
MPQWFEEGTAEFYSSLEVAGGRLRIGTPIATHIRTLRTREWLDAPTLFGVTKTSPYYSEREKVGIFYAQSWALAHMLSLAPEYRKGMARYAEGASFEEAFGKTPDAALRDLGRYVSEGRFPFVDLAIQQAARPDPLVEPLDDRAARMALAGLLLEVGKTREAETAYRKLAKENPDNAEIETALGALALRQRNHEEARRRLRRAIKLGSRQAATHFEYAMLLRESGDERAEVAAHLGRAIELNPNFAEAHFLLGLMFTHAKRDKEAIPHLERAAAILPRQSHFWHALSMAYHRAGNAAEAQRAAHRALENAATVNEAGMARAALRLTGQAAPPTAQASQPAVVTPQSWVAPKGDATVAGVLRRIDCFGASARLFIQTPGRHVALMITNPGEVLLRSASAVTFQFTCGPQKPVQVEVEYLTRPDSLRGTAGEVTAIEFR